MTVTVQEPDDLFLVIDETHDRWFDISAITYDRGSRIVEIPFWSSPSWRYPRNHATGKPVPFDNLLTLHDSDEPTVEDRERIGIYSFNEIAFLNQQVVIRADPKLRITCVVRHLYIVVGLDRDSI